MPGLCDTPYISCADRHFENRLVGCSTELHRFPLRTVLVAVGVSVPVTRAEGRCFERGGAGEVVGIQEMNAIDRCRGEASTLVKINVDLVSRDSTFAEYRRMLIAPGSQLIGSPCHERPAKRKRDMPSARQSHWRQHTFVRYLRPKHLDISGIGQYRNQ